MASGSSASARLGLKLIVALAVAGPLLWFVVAVTTAGIFRNSVPVWALKMAPFDARATAQAAQQQLGLNPTPETIAAAQAQAASALRRDATVVAAVTTLGVGHAVRNQEALAERSFQYAARLSRRDVPTQLWLLERNVQRNDIGGALAHFDTILRTSPTMGATLFPILASASAEPAIAVELNRLLRSRPNWRGDFLSALLAGQYDPTALYAVTRGLLTPADPRERDQLSLLLDRLVQREAFDLAWRTYVAALPERENGGSALWNGDFAREPSIGPFDWSFPEDAALAPERRPLGSGGFALYLPAGATSDVEAARQLVRLSPGRYAVGARVGNVSGGPAVRPILVVRCARAPRPELARADFPIAPEGGRSLTASFAVSPACPYQWISIWVRGSFDQQLSETPWISSIRIREL